MKTYRKVFCNVVIAHLKLILIFYWSIILSLNSFSAITLTKIFSILFCPRPHFYFFKTSCHYLQKKQSLTYCESHSEFFIIVTIHLNSYFVYCDKDHDCFNNIARYHTWDYQFCHVYYISLWNFLFLSIKILSITIFLCDRINC